LVHLIVLPTFTFSVSGLIAMLRYSICTVPLCTGAFAGGAAYLGVVSVCKPLALLLAVPDFEMTTVLVRPPTVIVVVSTFWALSLEPQPATSASAVAAAAVAHTAEIPCLDLTTLTLT
jgi:hypothetical protein